MRHYTGKLQGVIFDWSGTTIDYGCFAPTMVFVEDFRAHGVEITLEEARRPMGKFKRDHIQEIVQMPQVAERWRAVHGRTPDDSDVQMLFDEFIPRQMETITAYSEPIPSVLETVAELRARGLKIGSCTGYTREMMAALLPVVREKGYAPDTLVTPDQVAGGRPAPWMCFQNAMQLNIYPMQALVKVGDTLTDIDEGLNAGMWTIAVAKTGNELGLTEAEVDQLAPDILAEKLGRIYKTFYDAGAHYVVDSVVDILPVLDEINEELENGKTPLGGA